MNIGLIGFGEVGGILATDLKAKGADVAAWDLLMAQPAMREKARAAGIEACESSAALVRRSQVVISAVTASNTLAAARVALTQCCGASRWVEGMLAARPFGTRERLLETCARVEATLAEFGVLPLAERRRCRCSLQSASELRHLANNLESRPHQDHPLIQPCWWPKSPSSYARDPKATCQPHVYCHRFWPCKSEGPRPHLHRMSLPLPRLSVSAANCSTSCRRP